MTLPAEENCTISVPACFFQTLVPTSNMTETLPSTSLVWLMGWSLVAELNGIALLDKTSSIEVRQFRKKDVRFKTIRALFTYTRKTHRSLTLKAPVKRTVFPREIQFMFESLTDQDLNFLCCIAHHLYTHFSCKKLRGHGTRSANDDLLDSYDTRYKNILNVNDHEERVWSNFSMKYDKVGRLMLVSGNWSYFSTSVKSGNSSWIQHLQRTSSLPEMSIS